MKTTIAIFALILAGCSSDPQCADDGSDILVMQPANVVCPDGSRKYCHTGSITVCECIPECYLAE